MYEKTLRIMPVPKYGKWNISAASLGTEELAHLEMVATIVRQLTKDLTPEEIKASGFDKYYVDHTLAIWPTAAAGIPFNACEFQCKGDTITDLYEDMAAEQKARSTYDNILRLIKDPEIADPIRFLRAREVVHFQRFGEANREDCSNIDYAGFLVSSFSILTGDNCFTQLPDVPQFTPYQHSNYEYGVHPAFHNLAFYKLTLQVCVKKSNYNGFGWLLKQLITILVSF